MGLVWEDGEVLRHDLLCSPIPGWDSMKRLRSDGWGWGRSAAPQNAAFKPPKWLKSKGKKPPKSHCRTKRSLPWETQNTEGREGDEGGGIGAGAATPQRRPPLGVIYGAKQAELGALGKGRTTLRAAADRRTRLWVPGDPQPTSPRPPSTNETLEMKPFLGGCPHRGVLPRYTSVSVP